MHAEVVDFQRRDWLKGERDDEIERRCDMRIIEFGKCEINGVC